MKKLLFFQQIIRIFEAPPSQAISSVLGFAGKIVERISGRAQKIGIKKIIFSTVILAAALSFFLVVEKNFDGENWSSGSALLDAIEARKNHVPLMDYLNRKYPQENWSTSNYETSLMFIPLWQSFLYLGLKIFGSISLGARVWIALFGFATVVFVYYVGKKVYSRGVGLVAALTLATLPYYLVHVKSGFGYYAVMPLLVILLFYCFYLAHKNHQKKFLYLAGILIFLIIFNGWPSFMLASQIMLVFVLVNFRYKKFLQIPKLLRFKKILRLPHGLYVFWSKSLDGAGKGYLLGLRDYLLMLIIAGALFILASLLFAWYFQGPPLDVFEKIYAFWYTSRASWFNDRAFLDPQSTWTNISNLATSLFWKMPFNEAQGYLTVLITPRYPMFVPPLVLFWLIGIIVQIKRRLLFDKLCLLWLLFEIIGTTIYAGFTPRGWLFVAPGIVLTIGVGLAATLKFLTQRVKRRIILAKALTALFVLAFIGTVLAGYYYYFFFFTKHNSFLAKAARQAEIVKYVTAVAQPENSLIVLDEEYPSPKEGFYYFSSAQKYEVLYYQPEVIQAIGEHEAQNLARWERAILAEKEKIVYVINESNYSHYSYGMKLWQPIGMHAFYEIHADLLPAKVITYANGTPAASIYVIGRNDLPLEETRLQLLKNSETDFWSEREAKIDYLQVEGPLHDGQIFFNADTVPLLPEIRLGEKLKLSRTYSQINFTPLTDLDKSAELFTDSANIKIEPEGNSLFWTATAPEGYVVYKITNQKPWTEVFVQTYPVLNHDREGENMLQLQISEDGQHYKTVYKIKSNKNGAWEVPYEKFTAHLLKTNSKEIYLKLIFRGKPGETKIYSQEAHPTVFRAKGEGWLPTTLVLQRGINQTKFQGEERSLNLTFAGRAKLPLLHASGALKQEEAKEFSTLNLTPGLYRLWLIGENDNAATRKETQGIELQFSGKAKKLTLGPADLATQYKFLDFQLENADAVQITQSPSPTKSFLELWAVTDNETAQPARDYALDPYILIGDSAAISQKVIYASAQSSPAQEIINKNIQLTQGQYLLRLVARTDPQETGVVAKLAVNSLTRAINLGTAPIMGSAFKNRNKGHYQEYIASFSVENPVEEINLQLEFLGKSRLWLDRLEVLSIIQSVEAETLARTEASRIVSDQASSQGQAVFTGFADSLTGGHILFGTLTQKFEAGDYRVFYRLKASANQCPKTMARLDLNSGASNYDSREIWCSEFWQPNRYQYFSLRLNNYDPALPLGFNTLWYPKGAELWVDRIEFGKVIMGFPAEEITRTGAVVVDAQTQNTRAVFIQTPQEVRRSVAEGIINDPNTQEWRIILRLKAKGAKIGEPVANLNLEQIPDGPTIQKVIGREVLLVENQYQNISFDLENRSRKPMRFNLEFLGNGEIWLDYIDVVALK